MTGVSLAPTALSGTSACVSVAVDVEVMGGVSLVRTTRAGRTVACEVEVAVEAVTSVSLARAPRAGRTVAFAVAVEVDSDDRRYAGADNTCRSIRRLRNTSFSRFDHRHLTCSDIFSCAFGSN